MSTEQQKPQRTQFVGKTREEHERKIDEALKETFPVSDPPSFVSGAIPGSDERSNMPKTSRPAPDVLPALSDP